MSKVMERHAHNHFVKYLDGHDLLTPYQSGFRKNHSCNTCLTNLTDKWLKSLNEGSLVGVLAIDLSKGFDLINYNILMKKLEMYGCSDVLLNWFYSYLHNRSLNVRSLNSGTPVI